MPHPKIVWKSRALALSLACACTAVGAHGVAKPKHGGWVDIGGETTFELVRSGSGVVVYVEDHGKPVDVRGGHAELLYGSETGRVMGRLLPNGANSLSGRAGVIRAGDRLFVRLTLANGSSEVGEFRVP